MSDSNASKAVIVILRIYALLLLLIGATLAMGGAYLLTLGGSPYYLLSGLAVVASAVLLGMKRFEGAQLYGLMLLATTVWALWESGFDGWALAPRVVAPGIMGLILLIPVIRRTLIRRRPAIRPSLAASAIAAALIGGASLHLLAPPFRHADPQYQNGMGIAPSAMSLTNSPAAAAAGPAAGDWPNYGNDSYGTRFSPLTQITPANVSKLKLAWSFRVGEFGKGFEVTPLKVGRALYLCNNKNEVMALDAETGKQLWRFNPEVDTRPISIAVCRGVAYFRAPDGGDGECAERILTNTLDARLIALDARTGKRCRDFGNNGEVSLLTGMGEVRHGYYHVTSAPTIVRGKVVLGGWVIDNQKVDVPSGVIRAFDAMTGRLAWAFDSGRPDRRTEPAPGETYTRGTPNSWAPMSADEELGLVYVPTGNSSPDYFGGQRRPFDEKYSGAVVAIDANTGGVRWTFQTVHHDLWDYDVASQPTLVNYPSPAGIVRALIQPTKRGELFVLDRVTGRPLRQVVERRVPTRGAAPEERVSPTQPFSVGMPSFGGAAFTEGEMWGVTPLDQLYCRIKFRQARYDGTMEPPGMTSAIDLPGFLGGIDWGGVSVDADRGIVIVNSNKMGFLTRLVPRTEINRIGLKAYKGDTVPPNFDTVIFAPGEGAPYGVSQPPFLSPLNVPCNQPPYGTISAVDLKSGKLIWTKTLGTARDSGPMGIPSMLPLPFGTPNIGGSVTTRSGLFFIGAASDDYLRAYDTASGRILWRQRLPAGGQATPMTYLSPASRRQFVLIAAGGHHAAGTTKGDYILAYALPK